MPISNEKKEKVSLEIIKVLFTRFESFPEDASSNRNAPFHKAFLNAFADKFQDKVSDIPFFISLSSWLQGLNTTLGQTFFENVAHILSDGEKREYTSKKLGNLQITREQKNNVNTIITELSNSTRSPHLVNENNLLFIPLNTDVVNALDFSADVFIEEANQVIAIELKSVRPNSGEMRGEKQKILEGKSALFKKFPNKTVKFYMGFPFDPTNSNSEVGCDKTRFLGSIINMNKYFSSDEVLLANELWNFLSKDNNTMDELLLTINSIATTHFLNRYQFINDKANKISNLEQYKEYLTEWNLSSELLLVNNEAKIKLAVAGNTKLTRVFNHLVFNGGVYNEDRFIALKALL